MAVVDGGRSISSVLLLLPSGDFHAAVCTQHQDGSGEELTAAARGSWRSCRGGVLLELPEEDSAAGGSDELEYEMRNGHLVASTGSLPEGLAQEYAPGQPDSAIVQLAAQHLLIDARTALGASTAGPPAAVAPAILDGEGAQAAAGGEEEDTRPPVVIADGDGEDSDDSLGRVLARPMCWSVHGEAGAGNTAGGSPAGSDYADDFEAASEDEEDEEEEEEQDEEN